MIGKLFYAAFALGLIFNFAGDLSVYRENRIETENSAWLRQSYESLQTLDAVKIKVLEHQLNQASDEQLRSSLIALSNSLAHLPLLKTKAEALLALPVEAFRSNQSPDAENLLNEISKRERALLDERLAADLKSNEAAFYQIIVANGVDLVLILVVALFFHREKKIAAKMQKAMTTALAHVESVNKRLLKKMSQRDSKFKTTVHDLKNPLGSINGFAQLLQDEPGNNRSTMEMVQIIERISHTTLQLVGSVLENNDEEDETALKEDVRVIECLKETCMFLEPIARNKKQTISIDKQASDFTMMASRHKIQDVFYNIISNALKYSPAHSAVHVSCTEIPGYHLVEVRDQGPGFAKEDFAKLFLPGAKLSARPTAGEHSTGIGLYSAKNAIDSIKGQLIVQNIIGGGASVSIRFPQQLTV